MNKQPARYADQELEGQDVRQRKSIRLSIMVEQDRKCRFADPFQVGFRFRGAIIPPGVQRQTMLPGRGYLHTPGSRALGIICTCTPRHACTCSTCGPCELAVTLAVTRYIAAISPHDSADVPYGSMMYAGLEVTDRKRIGDTPLRQKYAVALPSAAPLRYHPPPHRTTCPRARIHSHGMVHTVNTQSALGY